MGEETEELDFDQTDFECAMGNRKFKKQTAEERIYGIWAVDDEEDDRPTFGDGRKRPKDSAPMRFVSGGVKIGSKTQLEDGTIEETDEEITILDARPEKRSRKFPPQQASSSHSSFGQPFGGVGSEVFAGFRNAGFQSTSAGGTADSSWMKSGKGHVVMQMMQKMGYVHGKGLGKSKQGIVEPVQAVQRPGRGAVGAYGAEAKGPKFGESAAEAQARIQTTGDAAQMEHIPPPGTWRKSNANRVKVQYKTLDEVISEGGAQRYGMFATTSSVGKIIDMTGPEQRVYDDFSSFARRAKMPIFGDAERTNFNIPEFSHNLNVLLDVTEEEICKTDSEIRRLKNLNEGLSEEIVRMEGEFHESEMEINRLQSVDRLIRRFCQGQRMEDMSLDDCKELFQTLRHEYATEYQMYGLDALALPILVPKIKKYFWNWDPLDPEQADYGFSMMSEWKGILTGTRGAYLFKHFDKDNDTSVPAFDLCVWHGWMPRVQHAALDWNPRNNGPVMVGLVQKWMEILPSWVLENFLEQVLIHRIKAQVDEWDPVTDTIPIESWLLPWHSTMGDRLLNTYSTLRQKLSKGLRGWMPPDRSALEIIRPWKNIFSSSTMHAFVSMNIVPKLESALWTIDISTTKEFDELFLFDWLDVVSVDVISHLLVKHFFPRYYEHLCYQLNSPRMSMPSLDLIKKNYMNWKNLFPQEIQAHQLVIGELKRVLLPILEVQSRLTGVPMPGMAQPPPPPPIMQMPPGSFGLPPPPPQFTAQLPPSSFKQLVESTAISNGLQFFPQRNKFQEHRQVYMFGDYSVYIDSTMLHYYNPPRQQWLPISLNQLLEMCRGR